LRRKCGTTSEKTIKWDAFAPRLEIPQRHVNTRDREERDPVTPKNMQATLSFEVPNRYVINDTPNENWRDHPINKSLRRIRSEVPESLAPPDNSVLVLNTHEDSF
jgi:hypothetical protein